MQTIYPRKRLLICIVFFTIIIYFLFQLRSYKYEASIVLTKIQPVEIWEYVADFSNMKNLNPTIINFSILDESGNYQHWKYSVRYSEHLSHWPYLENHAVAHFDIKANEKKDVFYIDSVHETCLIGENFCVNSKSTFNFFKKSSRDTVCQEQVEYECPAILSRFCFREVQYQRNAIMKNLKLHFQQ